MKNTILSALLLLVGAAFGQDSVWVPATRMLVKVPKPKPDTIRLRDTVYIPCPEQPAQVSKWSQFKGSFNDWVQSAIASGKAAVLDANAVITAPVVVKGNLVLRGTGKDTIRATVPTMFLLDSGKHHFDSLVILPIETAFLTQGLAINDSISNCRVIGGKFTYQSSLGRGVTAFSNCYLANSDINIQVYSQTANGVKSLHLYNVELRTDVTHNVYAHPNVNIHWEGVNASKSGRLALNYFSSGHDEYYGQAKYFRLIKCTGSPMSTYTVIGPADGWAIVDSCTIAPYGVWQRAKVTNSHLYNGGHGALINGTVERCTGEVWTGGDTTTVLDSRLDFATARAGGVLRMSNTTISGQLQVADRGNAFSVIADGGSIGYIFDGGNGSGTIRLNNIKTPPNNCRTGVIVQ